MDGVLVKIIAPKNNPPAIVQDKVLSLIQVFIFTHRGKVSGDYHCGVIVSGTSEFVCLLLDRLGLTPSEAALI